LTDERCCLAEYREACVTVGREVCVVRGGVSRPARALAVGEDYSLLAAYPDGTREAIRFGEVTLRAPEDG
ncbi:MAG: hypothetical protein IJ594_03780, partial [Oscillospiraceae bacterium]|nr:hypothetical protein [Oscillospiraceae bacterium]